MAAGRPLGTPNATWHHYTDEEKSYLHEIVPGRPHHEIVRMVNERFGTDLTMRQIGAFIKNNHLSTGLTGRYEKGHVPANKGTKGVMHGSSTSYATGNVPANRVPIGTELLRADGYVYIKITDGHKKANWRQKHIVLWEEANGPIPRGSVLMFANRDTGDVRLGNLLLAERADLAVMNHSGLMGCDLESTRAGILTSKLIRRATSRRSEKAAR